MNDLHSSQTDGMIDLENAAALIERTRPFAILMTEYRCAMLEI